MSDNSELNSNLASPGSVSRDDTISKIFGFIYLGIASIMVILVFILFILGIINVHKYNSKKKKNDKIYKDNEMIITETIEYNLLSYTKGLQSEPLLISNIIVCTNLIFLLTGFYLFMLCIQYIIIFVIYFKSKSGGKNTTTNNIEIEKPSPLIFVILAAFIEALIIDSYTKSLYIGKALPSLLETRKKMYNLKRSIKNHMYIGGGTDQNNFLNILNNRNSAKQEIQRVWSSTKNITTVSKMIFTYNVRNHIIDSLQDFNKTKIHIYDKFKPEVLKGVKGYGRFDPSEYIVYTEDDLTKLNFTNIFMDDIEINENDVEYINSFDRNWNNIKDKVSQYLTEVNDASVFLNKRTLEMNSSNLINYIKKVRIITIVLFIVVLFILATVIVINENYKKAAGVILTSIGTFFKAIWSFLMKLFGSKNSESKYT